MVALFVALPRPALAQAVVDRGETPPAPATTVYLREGTGVLGHCVLRSGDSMPFALDVSSTQAVGVLAPVSDRLFVGAELRGTVVRGLAFARTYLGDLSLLARTAIPLARGTELELAALVGPTLALLGVEETADFASSAVLSAHGVAGGHGGARVGVLLRLADGLSIRVRVGYAHHAMLGLPSLPAVERVVAPIVHVDETFVETGILLDP